MKESALDSTDVEILKILTYNSRTSYNSIASVLGLTANTVKNRARKILASKAIENFLTIPNFAIFGFSVSLTIIVRHNGNPDEVVKRVSSIGYLYMRIDLFGNISVLKLLLNDYNKTRSVPTTDEVLDDLLRPNQLVRAFSEELHCDFKPTKTDWKLIYWLILQPRIRINDLAKKASVTEKTVIRKLDAMSKKRVLDFTVQYNPAAMNNYHYFRLVVGIDPLSQNQVISEIHRQSEEHFMSIVPPPSGNIISVILFAKNISESELVTKKIESVNYPPINVWACSCFIDSTQSL